MRYVLFPLCLLSAVFLPWWSTVIIGIAISTIPYGPLVAIGSGLILDISFGSPLTALYGFSYLYTALFFGIAITMTLLEGRVLD